MRGADSPEVNLSDWELPLECAPDTGTFSPPPMDIDLDEHKPRTSNAPFVSPLLPGSYLLVIPHPHSTDSTPKIIPIDSLVAPNDVFESKNTSHEDYGHALWFPFQTRADFEATKISVKGKCGMFWLRPENTVFRLLEDDTLGPHMIFNSVRKYYCKGTHEVTWCEWVIDEPNTADTWAKYESELSDADPYPHCLVPLHAWLNEGLVTKRVTMHPILLRALCLPADIRNASGNGDSVLLGYMTTMKVYQRVLTVIFASLKSCSWNDETLECWDKLICVFHPGILITLLDGKEAAYFNACHAMLANYPCPKCLVPKCDLHRITKAFKLCTTESMKAVVQKALSVGTKSEKEEILKSNGIHRITHFLWGFRFSDPYAAYSYDTLHSDDPGKWGHHLWTLLLEVLEENGVKGTFAKNMQKFSRWSGLKHFNQVTTIHFTDGQTFYDILKILPHNDPLIHCIWAYQRYRLMAGMHCMPSHRLERLAKIIKDYEYWSSHAIQHLAKDIRDKEMTNHGSTRPNEGFQQEVCGAYNQTNFKNVVPQMNRIDEKQEAIARICMAIDTYDKQCRADEEEEERDIDETANTSQMTSASWKFGAPKGVITSKVFENTLRSAGYSVQNFDLMLQDFVAEQFPREHVSYEQCIQSLKDWRGLRDIVRCNPSFHGHPQYDSVLFNSDSPRMAFARVFVFLCYTLESKRQFDVALFTNFGRPNGSQTWPGLDIK
ncbi:hypothetical protein C8R44DRAFT_753060 [Mycena epipterygia]|nr:hypothetical protein C8R44DRAFT_753060 [Mycena epipterygia]